MGEDGKMGLAENGAALPAEGACSTSEGHAISPGTSRRPERAAPTVVRFAIFGSASVTMYLLFFGFADKLLPFLTSGTTVGAVAVIVLALAFCVVHGSCANYLLELSGLRELK